MTEKQNLLIESSPNKFSLEGSREWTGSFGIPWLRRMWNSPQHSFLDAEKEKFQKDTVARKTDVDLTASSRESYHALSPSPETTQLNAIPATSLLDRGKIIAARSLAGAPALVIAVLLNLFFGVSFGQVFFPTSWTFPDSVPRAIGVQVIQHDGSFLVSLSAFFYRDHSILFMSFLL